MKWKQNHLQKPSKKWLVHLFHQKGIKRGKNTDGKFLDSIKKVFHEHETSVQLTAAQNQLENAYKSARTSLKKGIRNEKTRTRLFSFRFTFAFIMYLLSIILLLYYIGTKKKKNCVISYHPPSILASPPIISFWRNFQPPSTPPPPPSDYLVLESIQVLYYLYSNFCFFVSW